MDTQPGEPGKLQVFDLLSSATLINRISSRHAEVAMFHVRGPNGGSMVAVKHVRVNGVPASKSIQEEFRILRELESQLGEPLSRTIPRPLLLLENEGTIIFSYVPGVPFDRLLRQHANVFTGRLNVVGARALDRHANRIGHWLRSFHNATTVSDLNFDHTRFLAELDSLLAKCASRGLQNSDRTRIREEAIQYSANASGSPMPAAATHGDFLPQNILLEDDQPGIIDFASCSRSGPVFVDLAHFVGYLLILSRKPLYDEKTVESVIAEFLKGYARDLNLKIFRLYVLRAILRITSDSSQEQTSESADATIELLSIILKDEFTGLKR
jgi:aminoglycoside phosphotransferase (APT) family kinase protein